MKTRYIITIAAAALVLSGCSRDEIEPGASSDGYLRLEVAGVQTVKGAICNSKDEMLENGVDSFWVEARKADYTGFVPLQKATYEDSQWSLAVPVQWTGTDAKTFFAHTNLPASGAVVTNTFTSAEQKQKLEYTLPTDARDQNDIMLGYYSGDGKVGGVDAHTAQIQFYHPLTAVKICDGGMCVDSINRVTLSGIYASGTVTVTYPGSTPAYDWGDTRTAFTDATLDPVSPSTGIKVDAKTKVIGVPFIIIPQDVAPGKVRIILDVTIDNASKTLAVDVPATTWQAGHTKSYTLSYGDATGYALAITAWGSDPHNVKLEKDIPELLPGQFSVSAADYVQFSRGNLQYQASTDTWRFAENQYDIIGNAPGNSVTTGRDTQADWIDYFGWGATGLNPYSEKPYSTDYSNSKYKTAATASAGETLTRGNKGDWGVLMGEGWYTLSQGQWAYLLTKRSVRGGKGKGHSYTPGVTYGGKSGLVIYPDDYTGDEIAGTVASLPEGVVFLPAASLRNSGGVHDSGNGYYWTSTASGTGNAYRLEFGGSDIREDWWTGPSRSDGNSVRLAKKTTKPVAKPYDLQVVPTSEGLKVCWRCEPWTTKPDYTISGGQPSDDTGFRVDRIDADGKVLYKCYDGKPDYSLTREDNVTLISGETYHYKVTHKGSGGFADNYETISYTFSKPPYDITVTSGTKIAVSWKSYGDCRVMYKAAGVVEFTAYGDYSVKQCEIEVPEPGAYTIGLCAVKDGVVASEVVEQSANALLETPENIALASRTQSSVSLTWDAVPYANSYTVKYGSSATLTTAENSITVSSGLSSNASYQFQVKANINADGSENGSDSKYSGNFSTWTLMPTPVNNSVSYSSPTSAAVTWDNGTGKSNTYEVYRDDNKIWSGTVQNNSSITDSGLTAGGTYTYRFVRKGSNGNDSEAAVVSYIHTAP